MPGGNDSSSGSSGARACYTKTELLAVLREVEERLYSAAVVDEVKQLPADQRQKFVAARLHLTAVIGQLNNALMRDIREDLERHTADLEQGITALAGSLARLEGAAGWAAAVSSVIGLLGKVVPLL